MEERGKVNAYACEQCGVWHHTINLNTGTTPFLTNCPYCRGTARSAFYRLPGGAVTVNFAWYRPTQDELVGHELATQEHVYRGGLLKKLLWEVEALRDDVAPDWSFERWLEFAYATWKVPDEVRAAVVGERES